MGSIKSKLSNPPKTRKGFRLKQSVIYNGKDYKIHSFPVYEKDTAFLRKYRKDGKLDSRDTGVKAKITSLRKEIYITKKGFGGLLWAGRKCIILKKDFPVKDQVVIQIIGTPKEYNQLYQGNFKDLEKP